MNISVIIGLILAFGSLISGYILEQGHISALFLLSPFIIVFGGTWGAVILSNNLSDILLAFKSLLASFTTNIGKAPELIITKIVSIADLCRQSGLLKLEEVLNDSELSRDDYLILKEGIVLTLEGKSTDEMRNVLDADIHAFTVQKQQEITVFTGAGGFSPTLGIIGTVMGLIHVLGNMTDTESLTASISTAFIATLYGVVFANLLYIPAANRLKSYLKRQQILKEIMAEGICLIAKGESSRNIVNKLSLYYQAFAGQEKKYKEGVTN